ncbi:hypothetical protein FQZ97_1057910 [compost metagenome]
MPHAWRHRFRCIEQRTQIGVDRLHELVDRQLREGLALHVVETGRVHGNVDAAGFRRDGTRVRRHRCRVEHVDFRTGSASTGRFDVAGHSLQLAQRAPDEEQPRTVPREGACNGAADGAAPAVDDGDLADQQAPVRRAVGVNGQ